jgi:hypothetical protein
MLSCFVNENQDNWDSLLPMLSFAYNTSVHQTTNHTPYEVLFGRKPKLPIDLAVGSTGTAIIEADDYHPSPNEATRYLTTLVQAFKQVYDNVRQNRDRIMDKAKLYHDRNIRPNTFELGDLVLKNKVMVRQGLSRKLAQKWEGPFVIVGKIGPVDYKIRKAGRLRTRMTVVHHNRLKRYFNTLHIEQDVEDNANETLEEPLTTHTRQHRLLNQAPRIGPKRPVGRPRKARTGVPEMPNKLRTLRPKTSGQYRYTLNRCKKKNPRLLQQLQLAIPRQHRYRCLVR